jgi:hypothetical protein
LAGQISPKASYLKNGRFADGGWRKARTWLESWLKRLEPGWKSPYLASSFESKILHLGGKSARRRLFPNFVRPDLGQGKLFRK